MMSPIRRQTQAEYFADPAHRRIGWVYAHPVHGPVYVDNGAYNIDGRLSNFWHYRPVESDGTLGEPISEYGIAMPPIFDARVVIRVELPT